MSLYSLLVQILYEYKKKSCPPQYCEAGVQGSANRREVENLLNVHMKEVE